MTKHCIFCGRPFTPCPGNERRSLYCSTLHRDREYKAIKKLRETSPKAAAA